MSSRAPAPAELFRLNPESEQEMTSPRTQTLLYQSRLPQPRSRPPLLLLLQVGIGSPMLHVPLAWHLMTRWPV